MIVYFSGTGNSRHIAKNIANISQQSIVNMGELLKNGKSLPENPSNLYVFVAPMYAWKLPRVVENFIRRANFSKGSKAYFILTAGLASGNANKGIYALCAEKGLECLGCACFTMPGNYIVLHIVPNPDKQKQMIAEADKAIKPLADAIAQAKPFDDVPAGPTGFLSNTIIDSMNNLFYRFIFKDKKFCVNDNCISCGICEKACALNNIKLVEGKPKWLGKCVHCMACISLCPKQAINYGKRTIKKRRYFLNG
ncbi:MAG: 4Fe-4S binding protein [Christensenellaceae bacterium]|nr:4Fe-4S binding protein [Christensenellaceae bacterium]